MLYSIFGLPLHAIAAAVCKYQIAMLKTAKNTHTLSKKKNNVRNRKIWTKHVNEHAVQQIFAEGNPNRGEEKHSKVCSAIECSFSVKLKNVQSVEPFHCVKGTQVYRWLRRRWSGTQFVVPFEVLKNVRLYKRLLFECFQECLSIAAAFFRVANEVLCVFSSSAQPFVLHKKFPLQSHRTIAYEFIKKSVAPYSFEKSRKTITILLTFRFIILSHLRYLVRDKWRKKAASSAGLIRFVAWTTQLIMNCAIKI